MDDGEEEEEEEGDEERKLYMVRASPALTGTEAPW
jgi:hypothetical protein